MFRVSRHPVHIFDKDGKMSPSAFIPFCEFGGNMSSVGSHHDGFGVPVCNSFQEKVFNDQLCYEVDLNKLSNKDNIKRELKAGFIFMMVYNEDRQVSWDYHYDDKVMEDDSFASIVEPLVIQDALIYMNTFGKAGHGLWKNFINLFFIFRNSGIDW